MDEFIGNEEGKSITFTFYAFEIYRKHLFPYYHALKAANPGRRVVIQEDGTSYHKKARRVLQHEIFEQGIEFMDHPSNSPDLAPIETLQLDHSRRLDWFKFEVTNARKATRDKAMDLMREYWQSHDFDERVKGRTSRRAYLALALRVKAALGTNKINDNVNINSR